MNQKTFTALIHKEQDFYVAKCPEVDLIGWGITPEEAIAELREKTESYFRKHPRRETFSPSFTTFEARIFFKNVS